jgi:hypothetical protein
VVVVALVMRVRGGPQLILFLTAEVLDATPAILMMMMMTAPEVTLRGINTAAWHFLYIITQRFFL